MAKNVQIHFGDRPSEKEHEWVAEWMHHEHEFRNLRYRCARCQIGPYTSFQIKNTVNLLCLRW